jgi:hypothetical protein
MTPEETIIFSFVAGGVGAFIGTYLQQKGKNLATREDISEITRKVESIKTDYAAKQHFSRLRYEREIELYREIWTLVHQFYLKSTLAFGWKIPSNQVSEISEIPTKESWQKSRELLSQTIEKNKPFYPSEIWTELGELEALCINLALLYQENAISPAEKRDAGQQAKTQYQKIEQAIRKRLDQFDNVN